MTEPTPMDEVAFKRWLQRAVKRNGDKLKKSDAFIAIFTTNFEREPQCALQLGIAVLLDKPIHIIAPHGQALPENVRRVAHTITFFDPTDRDGMSRAVEVIAAAVKKVTT